MGRGYSRATTMNVAMLTVGDVTRQTGGYLYHARVYPLLQSMGITIHEVTLSAATVTAQRTATVSIDPRRYDVIMVDALARTAVAPYIETWQHSCPVIAMVHELPSEAMGVDAADEAPLLRADMLIVVSPDGRQRLLQRGVPGERIVIAPPGCDRLGVPPLRAVAQPPQVLCVAQWIPRKGLDTLITAWSLVKSPEAVLHLYGERDADADYTTQIDALIAAARRSGAQIVVHGSVPDAHIVAAYQHARLFVLPSRFEGYGMVFAEALWAGLPVIACDTGPVAALVGTGGMLVPVDDVQALADAIQHVLADAAAYGVLAQAAAVRGQALPRWQDTATVWHDTLRSVVRTRA